MADRRVDITGHINSIQTLGTLDGPGVRFVVFMQGCNLRCSCCHNPETWRITAGKTDDLKGNLDVKLFSPVALADMAERYKSYFGKDGGVTLSGGEPLLQAEFCRAFFDECHERGINTCLDTSGCMLTPAVKTLLGHTDRVLLDVKYTTDADYRAHVGCGLDAPLAFLDYLEAVGIPTTLRQVIIPTVNDTEEQVSALGHIARAHKNVDKVELLPFRKVCQVKYDDMNLAFPFAHIPSPDSASMEKLRALIPAGLGEDRSSRPKERAVHSELSSGKVKTGC